MQRRWSGKCVDLGVLSDLVEDFLSSKGFRTGKDVSAEGYTFSATPLRVCDVREGITIKVFGNSKDFEVEFLASGKSRSSIRTGYVTTLFGGGRLFLKGLKSCEALEEMEREFWRYLEEKVASLTLPS
jgi:hypothetical protein